MLEDSRTLLIEHKYKGKEGEGPVEGISYSIMAHRHVGYGGYVCKRIEARTLDNHYLITVRNIIGKDWREGPLPIAIVDVDKLEEAVERMYREAKRIAENKAQEDNNKMLDITSRAEKITGRDKDFVPDILTR